MDKIIEWFGEENLKKTEERIKAFLRGEERFIISVPSNLEYYRQNLDEDDVMRKAAINLKSQSKIPGLTMPSFFADFGTVTMASYFGGNIKYDSTGKNLFIEPAAATVEEAIAINPLPVDHPEMDAAKALRWYNRICKNLDTKNLWCRFPDGQGVLNTIGSIVNQEDLFVKMYTEPQLVHSLVDKVTDFTVKYYRYYYDHIEKVIGSIWPYCYFPREFGTTITEDMMPLLPVDLYKEYAIPTLKRMNKEFGSLMIHCCGEWAQHVPTYLEAGIDVTAMEFHYPFTKIEQLEALWDKVIFIPFILIEKQTDFKNYGEYYEYLMKNFGDKVRFWFSFYEDSPDAVAFARKYGF
jgi:hypothetical protein